MSYYDIGTARSGMRNSFIDNYEFGSPFSHKRIDHKLHTIKVGNASPLQQQSGLLRKYTDGYNLEHKSMEISKLVNQS